MKHARAGELRIHYQDTGAGPPLVLLNGWSASGLIWPRAWVDSLATSLRVLRVCNRGTGHSDPVEAPFALTDMATDALAVLDAEGIDRAHVLGLSMGGMIAQVLASDHAERVDRLVLLSTAPPQPDFVSPPPDTFASLLGPRPAGADREEFLAAIWRGICAPGFPERNPQVLRELVASAVERPTPLSVIMLQAQAIAGHDDAQRLGRIAAPTLVVHGDADPLLPVENGRRLARLITSARYEELPGVGHLTPYEAPERTATLILEHLLAD